MELRGGGGMLQLWISRQWPSVKENGMIWPRRGAFGEQCVRKACFTSRDREVWSWCSKLIKIKQNWNLPLPMWKKLQKERRPYKT